MHPGTWYLSYLFFWALGKSGFDFRDFKTLFGRSHSDSKQKLRSWMVQSAFVSLLSVELKMTEMQLSLLLQTQTHYRIWITKKIYNDREIIWLKTSYSSHYYATCISIERSFDAIPEIGLFIWIIQLISIFSFSSFIWIAYWTVRNAYWTHFFSANENVYVCHSELWQMEMFMPHFHYGFADIIRNRSILKIVSKLLPVFSRIIVYDVACFYRGEVP